MRTYFALSIRLLWVFFHVRPASLDQEDDSKWNKNLIPCFLCSWEPQFHPSPPWFGVFCGCVHVPANSSLSLPLSSRLAYLAWPSTHPSWPHSWGTCKGGTGKPWLVKPENLALRQIQRVGGKARNRKPHWWGQELWEGKSKSPNLALNREWRKGYYPGFFVCLFN